jgi:hypothetical protein
MRIAPRLLSVKRLAPHTPSKILRLRVARYDTSCRVQRHARSALQTELRLGWGFSCWHRGHFIAEPPVERAERKAERR